MINFRRFHEFKRIFTNNTINKFVKFNFANQPQVNKKPNQPLNSKEEELKPEPFIPIEKMSSQKIQELSEKNVRNTFYYHGNDSQRNAEKKYNVMEFYSKKLRRDYIRSGEIDSHKFEIKVKRIRTKEDTIQKLDKNRETAAIIEGREEFPDIDIVIDKSLLVKLKE